jgi:hypothetical protein
MTYIVTTVRDHEIFAALSDEQRRAAGRIALDAACETFDANADGNGRITTFGFFGGVMDRANVLSFKDRLSLAGFPP